MTTAPGKRKTTTLLVLLLATASGTVAPRVLAQGQKPADTSETKPRSDLHGDPLPEGAVARLGTVRMRHAHIVSAAVFSRDGKSLIVSDLQSGVHVWDVAEGKEVRRFLEDDYFCHRLALSPDGRTLAVAPGDLRVRLFDPGTGRELGSLPQADNRLATLVFSDDGSLLATGTDGNSVRIWDVATQRLVRELTFPAPVTSVAFSSGGKRLAAGDADGRRRLWDVAEGKEVGPLAKEPPGKGSLATVMAPDGGPLAVWGFEDGSIRLFGSDGGKELRRFKQEGAEQRQPPNDFGWKSSIFASFSPDGKLLAASRGPGRIEFWDVETGKKLHSLACESLQQATILAFSPDGNKLASAGFDSRGGDHGVRLWDVARGEELSPRPGHGAPISSVAISPDGATVATAGKDGVVHLWERSSGKHLLRLAGHRGRWPQVAFSGDGRRVITWRTADDVLRIWDSTTGEVLRRLELPNEQSSWKAVSDDGRTAVSVDPGKVVRFHDLTSGKVTRELSAQYHGPMVIPPAGGNVVWSDGGLRNADGKELLHVGHLFNPHPGVKFTPDGRTLVAAVASERTAMLPVVDPPAEEVVVIDPVAGKKLRRFGDRTNRAANEYHTLDAVTVSADGRTVVTLGGNWKKRVDQYVTLWETETGRERGHYLGHLGRTNSAAISADGRFVVTGGDDTTALVWDVAKPRTRNSSLRLLGDVAGLFRDLASDDAEQAYTSVRALVNAPKKTVSFLRDEKSLFERANVQNVRRWIRDLDSDDFAERARASEALGLILDEAEPALKEALRNEPSAEAAVGSNGSWTSEAREPPAGNCRDSESWKSWSTSPRRRRTPPPTPTPRGPRPPSSNNSPTALPSRG